MDREEKAQARAEANERQQRISEAWKEIYAQYPEVLDDFFAYSKGLANIYRYWAEEQAMGDVQLDDHKVAQLLQQARTCDIVRTYITSRIDQDVAQPIKKSK